MIGSYLERGDQIIGPEEPTFVTVDELFDPALSLVSDGRLVSITYDPVLRYPRRVVVAGAPDASGSISMTSLEVR